MPDLDPKPHAATLNDLRDLLQPDPGPCVSIYCAAAPAANADQGRIRFKTAVREAERALGQNQEPGQRKPLLDPLRQLVEDDSLWLSQAGGIAAFRSPAQFRVLSLTGETRDLTVVADSFHVRPLIRLMQPRGRFQILCVSNDRVALYEGDLDNLTEIPLHPDVPRSMGDALGEPSRVTNPKDGVFVPADSDSRTRQLGRYFRRLDQAIWEHHARDSGLPLILAALPEYQGIFRQASHNRLLIEPGIARDPFKDVDAKKLAKLACEVIEPVWRKHIEELRERYDAAAAHDQGASDIRHAARQATFGKVETLLLRDGHHVGGTIDPGTGEVVFDDMAKPDIDDILDDLAERVLRSGGDVLVLPPDQMPDAAQESGLAAILRYPA